MMKNLVKKIAVTTIGTAAIALGLMQASTTEAQAASISYSSTIGSEETDWGKTLSVQKFNQNLGTLNSVSFTLKGSATGSIGVENTSKTRISSVNATLSSTIQVNSNIGGTDTLLVQVLPSELQKFTLAKFDNTVDYAGTSGKTINISTPAVDEETQTYDSADILNAFIGSGKLGYTIDAESSSFAQGGGNLTTNFSSFAGAELQITYDYTAGSGAAVPTPPTAAGTILAIGVIGTKLTKKGWLSSQKA